MRRWRVLLLAVMMAIPGIHVYAEQPEPAHRGPAATPIPDSGFQSAECPFVLPSPEQEGVTYECGFVTVPMSYARNEGTVALAVAILHATGPKTEPDPILWLEGGPGASALIVADTNSKIVAKARENRDVILYDQRGAGYSGYLECGAYQSQAAQSAAAAGTPYPSPLVPDADIDQVYDYALRSAALGYPECWTAYADQGIDLSQYNTETIARDSIEVLNALGYDQATLWGTSYGGRVAMAIMREYPERVRAAVLDSPLPIGIRRLAQFAELEIEPAEHLFSWCQSDSACNAAYPDLESRTLALIPRLETSPIRVSGDAAAQAGLQRGFNGDALVRLLTTSLPNNPAIAGSLPRAIADLEQGDATIAIALLSGTYPSPVQRDIPVSLTDTSFATLKAPTDARFALSLAMRTFVLCNDEAGAVDLDTIAQSEAAAPLSALRTVTPFRSAVTLYAQCRALNIDTVPLSTDPSTADIPTLVLSGDYDATTAPSWAKEAADAMPDATLVAIPSAGHATARWSACARDIVAGFVENPTATLDTACLADERPQLLGPNDPIG